MREYRTQNGYVLTDQEIERRAQEWEADIWEGPLIEVRAGRPRLSDEQNANLSFKCPQSAADMIERAAAVVGVKKSAFMRDASIERAIQVLAAHQT